MRSWNLALPAKELEKEILSILSVMDKRLQDVAIYQEEDFPGEQFFSIRKFSASLEANSRMLHLFARLLETQGDIKKLTKEEKNLAKDAKNYMDRHVQQGYPDPGCGRNPPCTSKLSQHTVPPGIRPVTTGISS